MADEWEEETTGTGKGFGSNNYAAPSNDDDSGWNDEEAPTNYKSDQNGYGGGGGGGRGGRGRGRGRDFGDRGGRDGGDRGGRGFGDRGGRGGGRYEDRGGRGGRGGGRGGGGERKFGDRNGGDRNGFGNDENGDEKEYRRGGGDRDRRGGDGDRDRRDGDGERRGGGRNFGDKDKQDGEQKRELYIPPEPTDDDNEIFNQGISTGINFNKYDKIPVKVSGDNPPTPITKFEAAGLKQLVLDNVTKSGYTIPTPIQKNGIPAIMAKRDLMACAQTGSGKTAAFLLPIIHDLLSENKDLSIGKPHALIISPTRELTIQIFDEARKFARGSYLKISIAYGGTGVKHQGDNIAKGCHILVATPGRLLDFVERGFVGFDDCRFVVLDEADRMLDMGFMPSVEKVMKHPTMLEQESRQTLMFSATFPEDIQHLAGQFLNNYIFITIGIVGGACNDVDQNFHEVTKFSKRAKLIEVLEQNECEKGTMVFVETQRNADFLASLLSETKFPTTSIHGARLQREREMALRDFKTGKMSILIATSVAARGLDIKNVSHVINYDLPKSIDEYVHRIGRTGRVGNKGKASSFYDPEQDGALAADLVKILEQADQEIPDVLKQAGGGRSSYKGSSFGGKDVRGVDNEGSSYAMPLPQEPEEEW